MTHVLHIDASARQSGSVTRALSAQKVQDLTRDAANATITRRDLAVGIPTIDEAWVHANFTPKDARTDAQHDALKLSDTLVDELRAANTIVIGSPIYNFSIAASLKAWIDQVARVGETFRYGDAGPEGLLKDKRVIIAFGSGGVRQGSDFDFASDYLRHVLGFLGIERVEFVTPDQQEARAVA